MSCSLISASTKAVDRGGISSSMFLGAWQDARRDARQVPERPSRYVVSPPDT